MASIALLMNPAAGRGRAARLAAVAAPRLRDAGFSVRRLAGGDASQSLALAREAVDSGVDVLVAVGGDGLVHLAAQAVAGSSTVLGVIPAGSGNDLARTLGIPRRDPERAADVVVGSRTRRIDLIRCGTTYVVTVVAAGFDAAVSERAETSRRTGPLRYVVATLGELRDFAPRPFGLEIDGRLREVQAVLVAVGNGPSYGGGMRVAEGAEIDDGWLDVVVVGAISRLDLLRTFPLIYTGGHTAHPAYERHRARRVRVTGPDGAVAYADGDRVGALPLSVEVVPSALEVLVP